MLVAKLQIHPKNARKKRTQNTIEAMGTSLATDGQHSALIGVSDGNGGALIIDGGTRLLGAMWKGLLELDVVLLPVEPSASDLLFMQATIDVRTEHLIPTERCGLWSEYQAVTGCTVTELAAKLGLSQPTVTKVLSVKTFLPEVRTMLDKGELSLEKAYAISQEPDPAKQLELLRCAASLTREQLRQKVKPKPGRTAEPKTSSARFAMCGGYTISVNGPDLDLSSVCDVLGETLRILKKGLGSGVSLASQSKVMKDVAKGGAR